MSVCLAIDPGSAQSAFVVYDGADELAPIRSHAIVTNEELIDQLRSNATGLRADVDEFVIEWMQPRGMPTSAQEFETLCWIGRFMEALHPLELNRLARLKVKMHVCGSAKANDVNIRAALIDKFGGAGGKVTAIGKTNARGPLYGIAGDEWAALALAVTFVETRP